MIPLKLLQAGLDLRLNEEEWRREWENILKLASSQPRTSGSSTPSACETETDGRGESFNTSSKTYESLEEIHVLALAHVLKRPIFVIADTVLKVGDKQAQMIHVTPITHEGSKLITTFWRPSSELYFKTFLLVYISSRMSMERTSHLSHLVASTFRWRLSLVNAAGRL